MNQMLNFFSTRKPNFSAVGKISYERYWRERGFNLNAKLKEREIIILDWIPAGAAVLDIGCGNSLLPVKLKEKGVRVEVADVAAVVLKGYEPYGLNGRQIDLEEIATLDFGKKYDYLILSEVLEHTKNPEEILTKLKPAAGYFIITVPNSAFYRYRLHLFFMGRFFTQWVYHPSEHLRYWSHADFLDWLKALNLEVVKCRSSNGLSLGRLRLHNLWKNLFGHQICYLVKT